jgi:hypothetical protein
MNESARQTFDQTEMLSLLQMSLGFRNAASIKPAAAAGTSECPGKVHRRVVAAAVVGARAAIAARTTSSSKRRFSDDHAHSVIGIGPPGEA